MHYLLSIPYFQISFHLNNHISNFPTPDEKLTCHQSKFPLKLTHDWYLYLVLLRTPIFWTPILLVTYMQTYNRSTVRSHYFTFLWKMTRNNCLITLPILCPAVTSEGEVFYRSFCLLGGQAVLAEALIACKPRGEAKFHHSWVISGLNRGPTLGQIIPVEKLLPNHQGWRNTKKVATPGVLSLYTDNTAFIPKSNAASERGDHHSTANHFKPELGLKDKQRWQL